MGKALHKNDTARMALLVFAGAVAAGLLLASCGGSGYGGGGGMYGGGGGTMKPAPLMFTLLMPTDGATGVSTTPTLTWTASTYATQYFVYVKKDSDAAYPAPTAVTTTSFTITNPLAASTLYDWHVVADNNSGMATSATFTFTTGP